MRNVSMKVEKGHLVIDVDLSVKGSASASGKSLVIASTEGNVSAPEGDPKARNVKVGLNVYRPLD